MLLSGGVPDYRANLKLELDARVGLTVDGSNNVSQWNDQSGSGNHATQGTGTAQPLLVASLFAAGPGVRFDGTSDFLVLPALLAANDYTKPWTFFCVSNKVSEPSYSRYLQQDATMNDYGVYLSTGEGGSPNRFVAGVGKFGIADTNAIDSVTTANGTRTITALRADGVNVELWKNGAKVTTTAISAGVQSANANSAAWCIGAGKYAGSPAGFANMELANLRVYTEALGSSTMATVFNYLNRLQKIY
jgi:hypothetical protein